MADLFASRSADFEQPIEMLVACHDQIRRFTTLCQRLDRHVADHGADAEAAQAAASILRYFDLAAPLHHQDEEDDLFPALRTLGDAALTARMDAIEAEHADLARLWVPVRTWLVQIADGTTCPPPAELPSFISAYPRHAAHEETDLYGAAQRLPADTLARISARMRGRRGSR